MPQKLYKGDISKEWPTHTSAQKIFKYKCITGLSWFIHRTQSEKLSGNPDWYIEWLGTVDRCIRLGTLFRSEDPPSLSVATLPPHGTCKGMNMTMEQFHRIAGLSGRVSRGQSSNTKDYLSFEFGFFSNCSAKQSVCLDLELHRLLWISAHVSKNYHFHHLSSPPINSVENSTTECK